MFDWLIRKIFKMPKVLLFWFSKKRLIEEYLDLQEAHHRVVQSYVQLCADFHFLKVKYDELVLERQRLASQLEKLEIKASSLKELFEIMGQLFQTQTSFYRDAVKFQTIIIIILMLTILVLLGIIIRM